MAVAEKLRSRVPMSMLGDWCLWATNNDGELYLGTYPDEACHFTTNPPAVDKLASAIDMGSLSTIWSLSVETLVCHWGPRNPLQALARGNALGTLKLAHSNSAIVRLAVMGCRFWHRICVPLRQVHVESDSALKQARRRPGDDKPVAHREKGHLCTRKLFLKEI